MKVILISGKARNGKDTVASYMENILTEKESRVLITHYGDLVKYVCKAFFNWDGEKNERGRSLLQYVGTDVVRKQNNNYWVDFIKDMLGFFNESWDYVIIPDARFKNEVDAFKESNIPTVHVKVVRPDFDNGLTDEQKKHPSETNLDDVNPDYTILNSGTLGDLETEIIKWVGDMCHE